MKRVLFYTLLALIVVFVFLVVSKTQKARHESFPLLANVAMFNNKPVTKIIRLGERELKVEIADTQDERSKGLSGRDSLRGIDGMLFIFDKQNVSIPFWTKNMLFAIDIIWIDDGKIVQIDENVQSQDPQKPTKFYLSNQPVDYVLEVGAGFCEENSIKVGDKVEL